MSTHDFLPGWMRKINTRSFVLATRGTPREVNRQILLNLVRENEPICRADLARRMEIARGMVTSLVNELVLGGMLYEGATVDSPRGRRPQMLFVRTRGRLAISVDVRFSRTYVMLGEIIGAWERIEPILTRIIRDRALTDNSAVTPVYREKDAFEARLRGATALVAAPGFAAPSIA